MFIFLRRLYEKTTAFTISFDVLMSALPYGLRQSISTGKKGREASCRSYDYHAYRLSLSNRR